MQWFRVHPYLVALSVAGILILSGALIVSKKSTVTPSDSVRAWGGAGNNLFDIGVSERSRPSERGEIYTEVLDGPPFHYDQTPLPVSGETGSADDFDFTEFLEMLSEPSNKTAGGEAEQPVDAYSFIPKGLISVSSGEKERTPTQQKLYDYGNDIGSTIQTYEETYRNAPQILRDQFEDRQDAGKNETLRGLASAMVYVGETLAGMEEVPSEIASAHQKLAGSYQEMGQKLALIPSAEGDQALINTMLAYNAAVEAFTKNFVALAVLFSVHGVTFASSDPGSIFVFTNASGF